MSEVGGGMLDTVLSKPFRKPMLFAGLGLLLIIVALVKFESLVSPVAGGFGIGMGVGVVLTSFAWLEEEAYRPVEQIWPEEVER